MTWKAEKTVSPAADVEQEHGLPPGSLLTPTQALLDYHVAVDKVHDAMLARDEAWAVYERARAEQLRQLHQT